MIDTFILNPQILFYAIIFLIGLVMLGLAPINYRIRKRKFNFFIPANISRYNRFELHSLIIGASLVLIALLGFYNINCYQTYSIDGQGNQKIVLEGNCTGR